jgi:hypothetical protein
MVGVLRLSCRVWLAAICQSIRMGANVGGDVHAKQADVGRLVGCRLLGQWALHHRLLACFVLPEASTSFVFRKK